MSSQSKKTKDPNEIRQWAEERGGMPSHVASTASNDDVGILRIDFPGYSGEVTLEQISWDQWFQKFIERGLALIYQEETVEGEKSNFNKIVTGESEEDEEPSSPVIAKRAAKKSASKKSAVKKTVAAKSPAKKAAPVKAAAKKAIAKKAVAKKSAAPVKKAVAKKAVAKKVVAKKAAPKKALKKAVPLKRALKTVAKKTTVKKAVKKTAAKKATSKRR